MNSRSLLSATLALACLSGCGQSPQARYNTAIPEKIMTPDVVETRIGTLQFADGVPTVDTTRNVYDHLDFLRGVQVFLNFIPATSLEGIRLGAVERGATRS